jgi:drug/metabolite transporter (DMT)-like permease
MRAHWLCGRCVAPNINIQHFMTDVTSTQLLATVLILFSALLHAVVNSLIKVSDDGLITRGCMNAVACIIATPFLLTVPLPGPDLWLLLVLSILTHALYPFFLVETYRTGDLSTVFPIARGSVPLLVTLFATFALEQRPGPAGLTGIAIVSMSIASFAFSPDRTPSQAHMRSVAYAFATGLIIAVYTVIDAAGLRLAPTPFVYVIWLFVLDGAFVALLVVLTRRRAVLPFITNHWRSTLIAGILGTLTYGLALFALALGPVAEIAALRETSIVFAALIGTCILGEPFGKQRLMASLAAVAGIVIMHLDH